MNRKSYGTKPVNTGNGRGKKKGWARREAEAVDPVLASKTGAKLSPLARTKLIERIVAGDSNAQVIAAMHAGDFLVPGDTLSGSTMARYRAMPETSIVKARLTEEAVQMGHVYLSEALVNSVTMGRAAYASLVEMGEDGRPMMAKHIRFKGLDADGNAEYAIDAATMATLANIHFRANELVLKVLPMQEDAAGEGEGGFVKPKRDVVDVLCEAVAMMVKEGAAEKPLRNARADDIPVGETGPVSELAG